MLWAEMVSKPENLIQFPYTDPTAHIDTRAGLAAVRQHWIEERQDTEVLQGLSSFFGQERASDPKLDELRFPGLHRKPRRAKSGANVTQIHYARQGIITPEMEYIAIRENMQRENYIDLVGTVLPCFAM